MTYDTDLIHEPGRDYLRVAVNGSNDRHFFHCTDYDYHHLMGLLKTQRN